MREWPRIVGECYEVDAGQCCSRGPDVAKIVQPEGLNLTAFERRGVGCIHLHNQRMRLRSIVRLASGAGIHSSR